MSPGETDVAFAQFKALWPTPKLTDDQALLWSARFKALDVATMDAVLVQLEKTCKHRPALSEFHEAVALAMTSGCGAQIVSKSSYWALAWRPSIGSAHGESKTSRGFRTLPELQEWITLTRGAWGVSDGFELHVYRRDVTGPHDFADHPLVDSGGPAERQVMLDWIEEIRATQRERLVSTGPSLPYKDHDDEPF